MTPGRYKVLSFFFDGVPTPEEEAAKTAASKGDSGGKTVREPRGAREHGPYASKMCHECHQRATNALLLPIEELCYKCHFIDVTKKYVHGPVAAGGCRFCHDPHSSSYPFLLASAPEVFCLSCHDRNVINKHEVHAGTDVGCTTCHDAHSSDVRYLLK